MAACPCQEGEVLVQWERPCLSEWQSTSSVFLWLLHTHTWVHAPTYSCTLYVHTHTHACMHPNKKKKNNYLVIGNCSLSPSLVPTYPIPHTNFLHKITSVNSDPALSSIRVRQYCCKFNLFFSMKHKKVFSSLIFFLACLLGMWYSFVHGLAIVEVISLLLLKLQGDQVSTSGPFQYFRYYGFAWVVRKASVHYF